MSTAYDKNGDKLLVTQYEGSVIESTGLIKMDFLGLKTLSIIKEALKNIKQTHGIDLDIDNIDINDRKTYQLYCEGRTTGTFQFESPGMQKYLKELQPSTFEDLIAMNALYRPGPMGYIPDFIARKQGRQPITYDIPIMEKYLKDTYGITVYQEQVMLLSRLLAGFTRGESDGLRKAMGKKLIDKLASLKPKFINGGTERGHDPKVLEKIWTDWEAFASYAFNKSHATCYSWVAFQTAYLKANYPPEYMAAVLSRNISDIEKITKFMDECRSMKIAVKGPDVNESYTEFSVNKNGDVRFGLGGIKGVGMNSVQAIIDERAANGPFKSIFDFVERINLSSCNRKTIESLAVSGAFDCFSDIQREDFFAKNQRDESFSEVLIRYGQRFQNDKNSNTNSLFGPAEMLPVAHPPIPKAERWNHIERLERERELVGMYLSGHPLDPYYMEVNYGCNTRIAELQDKMDVLDTEITFAGLVVEYSILNAKNGSKYAKMKIEDYSGVGTLTLFGQDFLKYAMFGNVGTPIYVCARYQQNKYKPDRVDLNITNMQMLEEVKGKLVHNLEISVTLSKVNSGFTNLLEQSLTESTENRGDLIIRLIDPEKRRDVKLKSEYRIPITRNLIDMLTELEYTFKVNA